MGAGSSVLLPSRSVGPEPATSRAAQKGPSPAGSSSVPASRPQAVATSSSDSVIGPL